MIFCVGDEAYIVTIRGWSYVRTWCRVVAIVPANVPVEAVCAIPGCLGLRGDLSRRRNHESYLVAVPGTSERAKPRLRWPMVKSLRRHNLE